MKIVFKAFKAVHNGYPETWTSVKVVDGTRDEQRELLVDLQLVDEENDNPNIDDVVFPDDIDSEGVKTMIDVCRSNGVEVETIASE